jgi:NAD(P)-dependent dehydrogenase (short-subunit alcohol dehydrogenase family)
MRTRGHVAIVNIASTRALMSEPNSEAYAASKGGILALTHSLAVTLGPKGFESMSLVQAGLRLATMKP